MGIPRRRLKHTKVGANCAVSIYRLPETAEFQVQQIVNGKVIGGKERGGAFETDKPAARSTAAAMVKELRAKYPSCRTSSKPKPSSLSGASASDKKFKGHPIIRQIVGRVHVGDSDDSVVAYAKTRLAKNAWESMSPADQRAFVREVKRAHAANRKTYHKVMTGRF